MTPQGKARAMDEIRRMTCDGGTDPQRRCSNWPRDG